jgi:predicted nucleotidyltransferase component of viral defense system
MKPALVEKTLKVIESISQMEFVKSYFLVGGTALSLQIQHRLSEDLDFMQWKKSKNDNPKIEIDKIKIEIEQSFNIERFEILEYNHIEIYIAGSVKLSFYIPEKIRPTIIPVNYLNNLILVDENCIASLKMEILLRRNEFRDYYDLYCILKEKDTETTRQIIDNALKYSRHDLKSKNLIGILTNSGRFKHNIDFESLQPKYKISPKEIENFMLERLRNMF